MKSFFIKENMDETVFDNLQFAAHGYYIRQFIIYSFLLGLLIPVESRGQEPIASSRYNDNFKILASDTAHQFTLFPKLKEMHLFDSDLALLSVGGEVREQVLSFNHESWGASPSGDPKNRPEQTFLLQRYMLHFNIDLSRYIRLFTEFKSGMENGRSTGPRPQIDADKLDINQAFADVNLFPKKDTRLTVRVGRQELNYGASRLISENEGPNVHLSFQGVKVLLSSPFVKLDAFLTRPVNNAQGVFDDKADLTKKFYGVYATLTLNSQLNSLLDLYVIGLENRNAIYLKGRGEEKRRSFGIRLFSKERKTITYDIESTYQSGTFSTYRIRAFSLLGRINYNFFPGSILQSISIVGQATSGDSGSANELNTFNPLYPRVYYGIGTPYWPSNIAQITPSAAFKLSTRLYFGADVHFLWRESINDGLYLVVPTRPADIYGTNIPSKHRFVGAQQDLNLTYNFTKYWSLDGGLTYLPSTSYIADTGYGKSIRFVFVQTRFRF